MQTINARIRAKVEHPFRIIKQQFGFTKVRYKGLAKNTGQLFVLFCTGQLVDGTQRNYRLCRHKCVPTPPKKLGRYTQTAISLRSIACCGSSFNCQALTFMH